ncbi:unnamed protein product [marine sediment metagenome]|uniref:HTH arsR-type domain-containing protein n=1 Tax=marine sediment metagenome TaxID=412755 RepID=X1D6K3_9ZZZZ
MCAIFYMERNDLEDLNNKDKQLLIVCSHRPMSVGEIARTLKLSPPSISMRLKKLEEADLITIEKKGIGKKTFVRTKKADKTLKYIAELLRGIKKAGGSIPTKDLINLIKWILTNLFLILSLITNS